MINHFGHHPTGDTFKVSRSFCDVTAKDMLPPLIFHQHVRMHSRHNTARCLILDAIQILHRTPDRHNRPVVAQDGGYSDLTQRNEIGNAGTGKL